MTTVLALYLITFMGLVILSIYPFGFNFRQAVVFAWVQTIGGVPWAPLVLLGVVFCGVLAITKSWRPYMYVKGIYYWKYNFFWLWDNEDDGIFGGQPPSTGSLSWRAFYWTAIRNPVDNLKYLVVHVGWPLYRKTWGAKPGGWYFQAGWNGSGHIVFSWGRNVNAF